MTYLKNKNTNCEDCNKELDCSCEVKDLGTKCVVYDGTYLENLEVRSGNSVTEILGKLDKIVKQIEEDISEGGDTTQAVVDFINVGVGAGIFKEVDLLKRVHLKTLSSSDQYIEIAEQDNDIIFSLNLDNVKDLIDSMQRVINLEGGNLVKSFSADEDFVNISFKTLLAGNDIIIEETTNSLKINSTLRVISDTLQVEKTGSTIKVNVLDDGVKKFYVNNLYEGEIEDGSETKPFKTLSSAVYAYIGTGNFVTPQYLEQKAKIIVKQGYDYHFTGELLVNGLDIELQKGVILHLNNGTSAIIDYDKLQETVGKFKVSIYSAVKYGARVYLQSPFVKNTGFNYGSSDDSYSGRSFETSNIEYIKPSANYLAFDMKNESNINYHNNRDSQYKIERCRFYLTTSSKFINITSSTDIVIKESEFIMGISAPNLPSTTIIPIYFSGNYIRFEGCRFVPYHNGSEGVFKLKNNSNGGKVEIFNCVFEGQAPKFFKFENEVEQARLDIQNCNSFFQDYTKLIESNPTNKTTTIINSYFKCKKGDVDLTAGNTISVSNYFEGRLVESLIKSPTILEPTGQFAEGTPYIYTNNDSSDKTTWRRLNIL